MKKLFILSFASILLLTGCGATETLSCSYRNTANNGTTDITYDIDHEGDEVKKVRITYDYDFTNNNNDDNNMNNDNTAGDNTNTDNTAGVVADDDNDGMDEANLNNGARVGDNTNNGTNTNTNGTNTTTDGNNGTNGNNDITTYNNATDNARDDNNGNHTDGVGTGTDGTTNDTELDDDGIVDGIVGSAIDAIVGTVTDVILDSAGLRDRHANVQSTYGNVTGFSTQTTSDTNYKVTYVIDYDTISDNDLARFNLSRDLNDLRDSYVSQGFTCK